MVRLKPILTFAFGLCCLGAAAQSVTVVLNDDTSKKFGADYIKDMYFQEATSGNQFQVSDFHIEPYSGGNATLSFTSQSGEVLSLDLYGPTNATYLMTGEYPVGAQGDYRIDASPSYTYYKNAEGIATPLESGSLSVSNNGPEYTLAFNFTLVGGAELNGSWTGELSAYSQYIKATLSNAAYNENEQPAGDFYVKFNDAAYNIEMAIVFTGKADDTTLAEGTYTYSSEGGEMTFGPKSYVDTYNPNSSNKMSDGVITVQKNEDQYEITMNLTLQDTRIAYFIYEGQIKGTPSFSKAPRPMLMRQAAGHPSLIIK